MRRLLTVAACLATAALVVVGLGSPSTATAYANAGPDRSVGRNVLFQLDGQAGGIGTGRRLFEWEQVSGPAKPVEARGLEVLFPYLRYDTPGEYVWRLTVDDTQGDVTTDEVTITVTAAGRMIHPHHHADGFVFAEYVRHNRDTMESCIFHKHIHLTPVGSQLVRTTHYRVPHGCAG